MSKFFSFLTLLALVVLSYGAQTHNSEFPQNSEASFFKSLAEKSIEIEDNIDRGKFLWLIQSEEEGLYDEISTKTNLPEEPDEGEVDTEDDDILAPEEISDPLISLEEEMPASPENDGALIYG
ncbi:hypothetical protein SteCoe_31725 [Stentor coeruleus]|uniref:Uncharacterized protein n=1 Tax=Stentor coeruleus TaxID=5963 RepID=A0A1R2B0L7_9CILI|nr:hypothetical protein SteCoe_31725 [Stentor coeruleus]